MRTKEDLFVLEMKEYLAEERAIVSEGSSVSISIAHQTPQPQIEGQ